MDSMNHSFIRLVAIFLCAVVLTLPVAAHSGRTDGNGGHYNTSTGEYHYHHGYSAHQHPNGVCPYDETASSSSSSEEQSSTWETVLVAVILIPTVLFIGGLFYWIFVFIIDDFKKKKEKRKGK